MARLPDSPQQQRSSSTEHSAACSPSNIHPSPNLSNATSNQSDNGKDANNHGKGKYSDISAWKWEVFLWAVGALFIAGIITTLAKSDRTTVESWPLAIQISTVIAILAQVAQSALLVPTEACIGQLKWTWFRNSRKAIDLQQFDEASRGPWGSLVLLFTLSPIPRLVHLGALITVFMLVFATFFQQAVQTRLDLLENTVGNVTVPRSQHYFQFIHYSPTYSVDYIFGGGQGNAEGTGAASDRHILTTIISSIVGSSQNLSNVDAACPAGSCTWEPYTTLGICYKTEDISSQLMKQPRNMVGFEFVSLPGITVSGTGEGDYPTMWLTTVFGSGNGTLASRGQQADIHNPGLQLDSPESNLDDIAHLYLAYQDPCLMKGELDKTMESWKAFKGTVRLCLQTLKTTHNSSTDTSLLKSHTNLTWNPSTGPESHSNQNWTTTFENEDFAVDAATLELVGGQIATSFNFSASFMPGGDNYLYGSMFASNFMSEVLGPDPLICPNGTGFGREAFDKRLGNVATGLTNAFRTADSSLPVYGKSFRTVQVIHVKYWFLAPPCALFVAITVFFLSTVVRAARVPVWKSSQLAVLYALHEPERLGTKSAMEKEAVGRRVRLKGEGEGLEGW